MTGKNSEKTKTIFEIKLSLHESKIIKTYY